MWKKTEKNPVNFRQTIEKKTKIQIEKVLFVWDIIYIEYSTHTVWCARRAKRTRSGYRVRKGQSEIDNEQRTNEEKKKKKHWHNFDQLWSEFRHFFVFIILNCEFIIANNRAAAKGIKKNPPFSQGFQKNSVEKNDKRSVLVSVYVWVFLSFLSSEKKNWIWKWIEIFDPQGTFLFKAKYRTCSKGTHSVCDRERKRNGRIFVPKSPIYKLNEWKKCKKTPEKKGRKLADNLRGDKGGVNTEKKTTTEICGK